MTAKCQGFVDEAIEPVLSCRALDLAVVESTIAGQTIALVRCFGRSRCFKSGDRCFRLAAKRALIVARNCSINDNLRDRPLDRVCA
ncbi:MAG TPA: hypothetical protein VL134_05590 [Leptolyngbya sp.]|nr:hypothetical protein [Leptolyngbya sp.]